MLHLEHFLGKGATRLCFYHPEDTDKCVKVAMRDRNIPALQQELEAVKRCVQYIGDYLPEYHPELIDTNLGPGLVCSIIRDDNGAPSQPLSQYVIEKTLNKDALSQLTEFSRILTNNPIPIYDFNPDNFLIQIRNGKQILRFTDLKTYNRFKPFTYLRMERCCPAISLRIVKRRLNKLFAWIKTRMQTVK
jgi:hypothetical protein